MVCCSYRRYRERERERERELSRGASEREKLNRAFLPKFLYLVLEKKDIDLPICSSPQLGLQWALSFVNGLLKVLVFTTVLVQARLNVEATHKTL